MSDSVGGDASAFQANKFIFLLALLFICQRSTTLTPNKLLSRCTCHTGPLNLGLRTRQTDEDTSQFTDENGGEMHLFHVVMP